METKCRVAILVLFLGFCFANKNGNVINYIDMSDSEKLFIRLAVGPESIAFDPAGKGPYIGVSDGRILKWQGRELGWIEFAYPKQRPEGCNGSTTSLHESICGRPLGLQFSKATGNLYIADASFGLLSVGPTGGPATTLASSANNSPFRFTNGIDIDQRNNMIYFTDSSTRFHRKDYLLTVLSGDSTGRLMKYNPKTRSLTVLLRKLAFPNGVAMSKDGTFLVFAETGLCRVMKYWLRDGRVEVFAELEGYPDNVKRNEKGEFWVALNSEKVALMTAGEERSVAVRLSEKGKVVGAMKGDYFTSISEVEEREGRFWLGSVDMPYVRVFGK